MAIWKVLPALDRVQGPVEWNLRCVRTYERRSDRSSIEMEAYYTVDALYVCTERGIEPKFEECGEFDDPFCFTFAEGDVVPNTEDEIIDFRVSGIRRTYVRVPSLPEGLGWFARWRMRQNLKYKHTVGDLDVAIRDMGFKEEDAGWFTPTDEHIVSRHSGEEMNEFDDRRSNLIKLY